MEPIPETLFDTLAGIWDLQPHEVTCDNKLALLQAIDETLASWHSGSHMFPSAVAEHRILFEGRPLIEAMSELQAIVLMEALYRQNYGDTFDHVRTPDGYRQLLSWQTEASKNKQRELEEAELAEQDGYGNPRCQRSAYRRHRPEAV